MVQWYQDTKCWNIQQLILTGNTHLIISCDTLLGYPPDLQFYKTPLLCLVFLHSLLPWVFYKMNPCSKEPPKNMKPAKRICNPPCNDSSRLGKLRYLKEDNSWKALQDRSTKTRTKGSQLTRQLSLTIFEFPLHLVTFWIWQFSPWVSFQHLDCTRGSQEVDWSQTIRGS